jgi:enediyne biosynthesis protein E4
MTRRIPGIVALSLIALPLLTAGIPRAATTVTFTDVTAAAGIRFVHTNGAFGKKYLPETLGSGCAFIDVDGDGWQDLFFVNSKKWPGRAGTPSYPALYRNNRDGTFSDITRQSGLAFESYGLGVTAADYDNDGRIDIYITALDSNRLFRNVGAGKFVDVTRTAGVADGGFSTSAAWLDYDRDGRLDLFVAHYVEWSPQKDLFCTIDGAHKSYCTPESYTGESSTLFRNRGDGTFENATIRAGLKDPTCKALGVAVLDFDNDGWPDLFVANDTQPNRLYRNTRNGTFEDVAVASGVAFNEAGVARAGMGTDAADYDRSGRESIIVGNFSNEMMGLYHNEGNGLFIDEAAVAGIGRPSLLRLTFACFFFDYDLDGWLDIFAANGHVADDIQAVQKNITYAQPPHLFHNVGRGRFEESTGLGGRALQEAIVARGAAYGDYDNDGDLDLAISTNAGRARLLRNDGGNANHFLTVRTAGTVSNRDGIGARVTVKVSGSTTLSRTVKSGSSYLSQSQLPVTFGLGSASSAERVDVEWPSGRKDALTNVRANQAITVQESRAPQPSAIR